MPCVELGYRLGREHWGQGCATEAGGEVWPPPVVDDLVGLVGGMHQAGVARNGVGQVRGEAVGVAVVQALGAVIDASGQRLHLGDLPRQRGNGLLHLPHGSGRAAGLQAQQHHRAQAADGAHWPSARSTSQQAPMVW